MKTRGVLLLIISTLLIAACDGGLNQPGLNLLPDADAGDNRIVTLNIDVNFSGSASRDAEGGELSYNWSFGDGSSGGAGEYVTHRYSATGRYTVTLTVTDEGGYSDDDTILVNVVTLAAPEGKIADHSVIHELWDGRISEADIKNAKNKLHIGYGHTSHGSQITTGMGGLVAFANNGGLRTGYSRNLFSYNAGGSGEALDLREGGGYSSGHLELDAGYYPSWVDETQDFLDDSDYDDYNVIMWSWCGQVSGKTEQSMIDEYLEPMAAFEAAHPEIVFIYMTGHLDGSGADGNLHLRNEQIRNYCSDNNKWLFDFADIESHDPDGNAYLDLYADDACGYDGGNWAIDWQNSHTENLGWYNCSSAHSQPLNANMKAYAAWWIFTEIAAQM